MPSFTMGKGGKVSAKNQCLRTIWLESFFNDFNTVFLKPWNELRYQHGLMMIHYIPTNYGP